LSVLTRECYHCPFGQILPFEVCAANLVEALRAGASGYLGKGVEPEILLDAIRNVAAGESLLSPTATRALIANQTDAAPARVRSVERGTPLRSARFSPGSRR
jgi:DNA-binding NarL/FixJ family response regulator